MNYVYIYDIIYEKENKVPNQIDCGYLKKENPKSFTVYCARLARDVTYPKNKYYYKPDKICK